MFNRLYKFNKGKKIGKCSINEEERRKNFLLCKDEAFNACHNATRYPNYLNIQIELNYFFNVFCKKITS